jgi:hypothetical protein
MLPISIVHTSIRRLSTQYKQLNLVERGHLCPARRTVRSLCAVYRALTQTLSGRAESADTATGILER